MGRSDRGVVASLFRFAVRGKGEKRVDKRQCLGREAHQQRRRRRMLTISGFLIVTAAAD